ncbi:MAG TPA: alpha-amylase family glycosyl hydrolase [Rectinemataceae bacterium]|nr:alpha-amylase family glycosyl hydrolase [Rectinemataceae bacterium]
MSGTWGRDAVFYHIYPLGFGGAPKVNDEGPQRGDGLRKIEAWLPHIQDLGCSALLIGPCFESETHGYDTIDYRRVDRRLGTEEDLEALVQAAHGRGIRVILDAVFNHVGRAFPQFKRLREQGSGSGCASWFHGVDFSGSSPLGDPFSYTGWREHYTLVKLNLENPNVTHMLLAAVDDWINRFDIDGLRLDAADCLDFAFIRELSAHCRSRKSDFWLLGEVIHGNYRTWVESGLDSVTNYELWKGLWSSHVDGNYFELAHSLRRQFAPGGIYEGLGLYNFADNHDVDRIASLLGDSFLLYPHAILLYSVPGIPSLYYGSEWGLEGRKEGGDDRPLRPALDLASLRRSAPEPGLAPVLARLAAIRKDHRALRFGEYRQCAVAARQFAFERRTEAERIIVAVNAEQDPRDLVLPVEAPGRHRLRDLLNPGYAIDLVDGMARLRLDPSWGRILLLE